jgi:hypothetical protein
VTDLLEITPALYAEVRNWSRWKAWRHFRRLEAKHGEKVIKRRGRILYTTAECLKHVAEPWVSPTDPRVLRRLDALEARANESEGRINGLANEVREFRRKAHGWYTEPRAR